MLCVGLSHNNGKYDGTKGELQRFGGLNVQVNIRSEESIEVQGQYKSPNIKYLKYILHTKVKKTLQFNNDGKILEFHVIYGN